jgi:outer membrane protein
MKKYCILPLLLACTGALAQSPVTGMPEGTKEVEVGVIAGATNRSEGGKETQSFVVPYFSILWSNGVFVEGLDLGMHLSRHPNFRYGPTLFFELGSERADTGEKGKAHVVPGAFFSYRPLYNVSLDASVRYGVALDGGGVLVRAGAYYGQSIGPHSSIGIGTGLQWGSHAYLQSYYGITPEQSEAGLGPVYRASSGIRNVYAYTRWRWQVSKKYTLNTGFEFRQLRGSAAASPVTESRNTRTVSTSLMYIF